MEPLIPQVFRANKEEETHVLTRGVILVLGNHRKVQGYLHQPEDPQGGSPVVGLEEEQGPLGAAGGPDNPAAKSGHLSLQRFAKSTKAYLALLSFSTLICRMEPGHFQMVPHGHRALALYQAKVMCG